MLNETVYCFLLGLIPYVLAVWPGSWLVKLVLSSTKMKPDHRAMISTYLPMSNWIGVFERWLVILLVSKGEWSAVGFIVAAKGLLRFPEIQRGRNTADTSYLFSSYILLGTLASILLAVLLAQGQMWLCMLIHS